MRGGRRLTGDEKHDYEAFIAAENSIVDALVAAKYTLKAALEIVGLSKSSWHYRHHPRRRKRDDGSACHVSPKQLTAAQRKTVASLLVAGKRKHHSVARIFFDHLDGDGEMVASLRTFYRVHAELRAQNPLAYVPTPRHSKRGVPVVAASGPGPGVVLGYYLVASIVYVEGVSPVYGVGFVFAKDCWLDHPATSG